MSNLGSQVILRGGGLSVDYVLDQFHFHWGSRNDVGSEHLIDGKAFPLEMHMVHHSAYDSSQLAVLSFLFEMHQTDNPNFNTVLRYFDGIIMPGPRQALVGESEIHPEHHGRRQSNTTDGSQHQERNRDQTKQLSASHASSQQLITNSAHSAAPQGYLWTKSIH
ncbi:hypothetical protein ACOMHN_067065 [Nucella lapillus]